MRSVIVLSLALAGALVGAYATWTRPEADLTVQDRVAVYDMAAGPLASILWESKTHRVQLQSRNDERGEYLWVTQTKFANRDGAPDMEDDGTSVTPKEPSVQDAVIEFKASERGEDLWSNFAPLLADRRLPMNDKALSDFGLDDPTAMLTIGRKGAEDLTMKIGAQTWGKKHVYVQKGDDVWLVPDSLMRNLQYSINRINGRKVQPLGPPDVASVTVTYKGETMSWKQTTDDPTKLEWTNVASGEIDNVAGTWIEKALRLTISGPIQNAELPTKRAGATPLATVVFTGNDGTDWNVKLSIDETSMLYAESEYTRHFVKTSQGSGRSLSKDLDVVFAKDDQ